MKAHTLGLWIIALVLAVSCNRNAASRSFDQEFQLTIRAGRGELSDTEKSQLLRENHPILAQVGEPQLLPLMEIFADLPPNLHAQLLEESYIKWKLEELPNETQTIIAHVLDYSIRSRLGLVVPDLNHDQPHPVNINLSDVDVGFAVVELPKTRQKVVSWYAFGSSLPSPVWITIVNSPASTSEGYVQAHMQRLPLLRTMKASSPPAPSHDRVTYVAASGAGYVFCSTAG